MKSSIAPTQICPNLQPHWQLEHRENSDQWVLQAGDIQHPLTPETAYILQHFLGNLSIAQIQAELDISHRYQPVIDRLGLPPEQHWEQFQLMGKITHGKLL